MEDENMILPDDFEDTPTEEVTDTIDLEETTEVEDIKPTEEVTTPEQKLKIKYNSEEKEISLEEARDLAQKGMNYEKGIERAKQEARDATYAEMGYTFNGVPITTEAEYKQAVAEQELMNKYKDLDPELRKELIDSRKDRIERQTEKQQNELKQAETKQYNDFYELFTDVKAEDIKPETWLKAGFTNEGFKPTGTSLKHAYMEQERADLLIQAKVGQQNQKNRERAPVASVSAHGTGEVNSDAFIDGFDSDY